MTRIFLPPEQLTSDDITITGDNARHLSLVLRINPGESIIVFDGQGYRYECTVQKVHKKEIIALLNKKEPYSVESPLSIILAQGIAKGEKMDLIVQKSTELGVSKIIPLVTERTEVRHTQKVERWRKIAHSASQQSGRDRVPEITEPMKMDHFLSVIPAKAGIQKKGWIPDQACLSGRQGRNDKKRQSRLIDNRYLGLILSESHSEKNLKQLLCDLKDISEITLLVGPEGGFSKEEVGTAVDKGFLEVSLGPRILRTETAPIAAISIIQYERGDMG
ncbi:MAG: 16S rRNA (uracil(1498)-N(3))-methyltransferase [Nitrospiraceae bacterium]|nr:MAG: 16S rRNA (uracil(1498)-N(3))-methyltransferase [Nitrospiraceae bacterium]